MKGSTDRRSLVHVQLCRTICRRARLLAPAEKRSALRCVLASLDQHRRIGRQEKAAESRMAPQNR